jgi:proline iminopeptidase
MAPIHVETVGRVDGIPAVYLHGGPAAAASPIIAGCSIRNASRRCSISAGGPQPTQGRRDDNTLPHLIADMEMIREKFGFRRWMIVGGSGATLAGVCRDAPDRVTGIVLRATFSARVQSSKAPSSMRCHGCIPVSPRTSSACCRRKNGRNP